MDDLYDDLVTMDTLVYDCLVDESLTFKHMLDMPDIDRLRLMMSRVCMTLCTIRCISTRFTKISDQITIAPYIASKEITLKAQKMYKSFTETSFLICI